MAPYALQAACVGAIRPQTLHLLVLLMTLLLQQGIKERARPRLKMAAGANLFELLRGKPAAEQLILFKAGDALAFRADVIHHAEVDAVHFVLLAEEIAE